MHCCAVLQEKIHPLLRLQCRTNCLRNLLMKQQVSDFRTAVPLFLLSAL
jgi:hypothetical protein